MQRTGRTPVPAGSRTAARWALLCALLLGLFLMHGSPTGAAGCHPQPPAAAGESSPHAATAGADERTPAAAAAPYRPGHAGAASCVSTQARDHAPLAAPGPATVWTGAVALAHPRVRPAADGRGRAPPEGGRELLTRVGVARR
ncbi:hypothetical protein AB0K51_22965 [Kitasatospora sp. NPDC049285]|uniref:hypothetical protein n=1 Tax=Kitasatospora sp. NPDC049285 TaxID=3157096 RepID=UPI0034378CAD